MSSKLNGADPEETVSQNKAPLYISLTIIGIIVLSYFFIPGVQRFLNEAFSVLTSQNEQQINTWVGQFGFWGPVVIILAMILQMFLIIIPSPVLIGVAVFSYGTVWGSILAIAAIFCASTAGYFIGAYLGPPFVARILGPSSKKKVERAIDDYGFWAVIVFRLNPFLSDDAISFVGGMLQMGYWRFIVATIIGVIPLTVFIAYIGENMEQLESAFLWVGIVSLVLLALYIWWDRKFKK